MSVGPTFKVVTLADSRKPRPVTDGRARSARRRHFFLLIVEKGPAIPKQVYPWPPPKKEQK
jgi:hypothetical protein